MNTQVEDILTATKTAPRQWEEEEEEDEDEGSAKTNQRTENEIR